VRNVETSLFDERTPVRRPSRLVSALLSFALIAAGVIATSVVSAAPAQAAPGDPFPAADPLVFVAQNQPTGLFKAVTDSTGTVSFQAEGPTSAITYNSISYNTANNYLYGIVGSGNASIPTGSLIRIGQGGVITRVGTSTYPASNAASFGSDGLLYIGGNGAGNTTLTGINPTTGAVARTVTLSQSMLSADFTFANGFFWGETGGTTSTPQLARINPANGAVAFFPAPFFINGGTDIAGAAWTFGNGNLGFSQNTSGTVSQVAVTNPASASPIFTLVSRSNGPASTNNDGAASPGQPTDLSITKSGPVVLNRGGTVSYTITVTNNGPGNSSGFTVSDVVPAVLTGVASSSPGCTVSGNTVTCVGGRTLAGESAQYTITANVPAGLGVAVTNTASVTANEADPNSANNTASTTGNPVGLSLVKHAAAPVDANADGIVDAGDTIQFSFTATNTGLLPINGLSVSDPKVGAVTCPAAPLAPGASTTCTADAPYTITAADVTAGGVDNSATATGTPQGGTVPITSAPSTTHTPTTAPAPGLTVVKSASPSDAASFTAGQLITYTFVVTNTGNVPLEGVTIDDSAFSGSGTLSAIDCPAGASTLAAGAQVSCTATYSLTQADVDAGQVTNSATATGTPPGGDPIITPPSQVQIPVDPAPAVSLVKSADPATANAAGDTITYSFRVTNTGNVTLADPSITETAFSGTGTAPAVTCPTGPFEPGQTVTCTATYSITQADVDAGVVTNSATAQATPPTGAAAVSQPSSAAVSIAPVSALTIVKSASPTTVGAAGDAVTYSFLVTNTGNVTLTDVAVTDTGFTGTGTLGPVVCPAGAASLAPGASVTCTVSYTFTQADIDAGSVTNSATATGTPPGGGTPPTSPPSQVTVGVDAVAAISLAKSASPATISAAGDTVTYSFAVTNTGAVTLADVQVAETAFSGSGTAPSPVCPSGSLAPGDVVTCTATYVATQADIDAGTITNTATATATPPAGIDAPVSAPSSASVEATPAPSLSVTKSADTAAITEAGQVVHYSFLVTNTGNVTMTDIRVVEGAFSGTGTLPAATCPVTTLAPGASVTCTTSYTVTQDDLDSGGALTNTATATGTPPGSDTPIPSEPSSAVVPYEQAPALSLVKSASPMGPDAFRAGQDITYTFVVTNTGNLTIFAVQIEEGDFSGTGTLPAPDCPSGPLAPGAQLVCTTHYTVTQADVDAGKITNTATATGTPPGEVGAPPTSPPSSVTVPAPAQPAVSMVKTASVQSITRAGQTVTYTFTVTNTGNVTVTAPTVHEGEFTGHGTLSAPSCPALPAGLAPGQIVACTATYTAVAADLAGGPLSNTATVTATPPGGGEPISSPPSTAAVKAVPPAAPAAPLASTGSTIAWGVGGLALALFAAGGVLMLVRRRRPRDQ
jgi:uncharacterized repeat protein (TIGR01451 family)